MKVIFLDIDGVLNQQGKSRPNACIIENRPLGLLSALVRQSGAKVVLTSSWRLAKDRPWYEPLARGGVSVIGQTVCLNGNNRHREILQYLDSHKDVEDFVILDDRAERWGVLKPHHVCVAPGKGLTEANVARALRLLGSCE